MADTEQVLVDLGKFEPAAAGFIAAAALALTSEAMGKKELQHALAAAAGAFAIALYQNDEDDTISAAFEELKDRLTDILREDDVVKALCSTTAGLLAASSLQAVVEKTAAQAAARDN